MAEGQQKLVKRTEADVGIKAYVGSHPKVIANVKERFSDFHVHEIDPSGKRVVLTDLGMPKEVKKTVSASDPDLLAIVSEEIQNKVEALHQLVQDKKHKDCVPVEIDVTELDKQQRTKVHRWIANYDTLTSATLDKEDKKFIKVEYATRKSRGSRRPETRLKYTHCVLYKEGIETSDAINYISKKLRIQPNLITYAGTKDKQAKTTQRICFSNVDPQRIISVSNYSRTTKFGNFEYAQNPLQLGALKGNHFHILLKNVRLPSDAPADITSEDVVQKAVNILKDVGFINFYGLQRFGSYDASTHAVGKCVLQMKWERAFDLILQPRSNDQDFMVKAKKIWFSERDPLRAVKLIPGWFRSIESNLFHGLSRHYQQRDFLSAFQRIPRNVRSLYLHAFQSYVWNHVASFRVEKFGLKPIAGDCVYVKQNEDDDNADNLFEDLSLNIDIKNVDAPELPESETSPKAVQQVKILTEEDVASGKYTISDVLQPLIGTEITKHPNKAVQDFYDNLLLDQGLQSDCFAKFKPKHEAPKGSYRHLIVQPKNVDCKIIHYAASDNMDKFIPSDLDLLQKSKTKNEANGKNENNGKNSNSTAAAGESENTKKDSESQSQSGPAKDRVCAVVEFSLPSSAYATMALREILQEVDESKSNDNSSTTTETESGKEAVKRPAESNQEEEEQVESKKTKTDGE